VSEEDYLSPQDVARRLNVTDRAILDLIYDKKLPAVRVGAGRGVWRIAPSDLERYLAAQRGDEGSGQT
jgi:excisionase family DNA binding protein